MISNLAGHVRGAVYAPGDAGYAPELAGFNTAVVHAPDAVVAASCAEDVAAAVRFARAHGHAIAVQGTGHGASSSIRGGVMISTRGLDQVHVDRAARTATVGAGARWSAVIAAAAEHGLAAISGSSGGVGVAGYLLGGGLGPLARSHGFGSDYLIGATVATGDGELVEASATSHADLLWALRGGKLGLGIATEFRLRLVELRALYAGALFFDEDHIEAALRAWIAWTTDAPPQVSTSVAIVRFPALDVVPPPLRGRRLLSLRFAYPGDPADGARLAAPLRAVAPIHLDALGELPIAEVARIHSDPDAPCPSWSTGMLLTHADQDLASALLAHVGKGTDAPFVAVEVRHLGEATTRDVEGGSAVGGRSAAFALSLVGAPVPALFASVLPAAAGSLVGALRPWVSLEGNINFAGAPVP
ncbi:MAG: FAD-binding oxidoreductase, partial [Kofleriaceae bacterium]